MTSERIIGHLNFQLENFDRKYNFLPLKVQNIKVQDHGIIKKLISGDYNKSTFTQKNG